MLCSTHFLLFIHSKPLALSAANIWAQSSLLTQPNEETPLQTGPEACLLGGSRSRQADEQYEPFQMPTQTILCQG